MAIKFDLSVKINKPVGAVFEFMADPGNDMLWQSGVLDSKRISEGPMGVGTLEESENQLMGRRIKSTLEVTEYEINRKITYKTTSGPIPFEAKYIFDPISEGETRVTFVAEGDVGGFFKLAEPLVGRAVQREWEANLRTLKDIVETQS